MEMISFCQLDTTGGGNKWTGRRGIASHASATATGPSRQNAAFFHQRSSSASDELKPRPSARSMLSSVLALSLYTPRQPESPIRGTYISRVSQQVLLKGAALSRQPLLRPDAVGQVPHDDT